MASCPNYNAPEFKEIEALFGRTRSTLAFHKNNDTIPSPELAARLLRVKLEPVLDYEEAVQRLLTGFEKGLVAVTNTPDRYVYRTTKGGYTEIAAKVAEWKNKTTAFSKVRVEASDNYETFRFVRVTEPYSKLTEDEFGEIYPEPLSPAIQARIEREVEALMSNEYYNKDGELVSSADDIKYQLTNATTEQPIQDLDNIIKRFVAAMGGNVTNVGDIVINGKKIDAVAVVDILNRAIQIADGKADITTLPEEAVHLFIELLPANHPLLKEMLADIKKKQVYQDVLAEYGTNEFYLNPDGTVNTDKIAKEAIGKHIAAVIVGRYKDTKSMSFWKRLWRWISERLAGKKLDAYTQVAKDILGGKLSKIEETAAKKANKEGRYWFQLPKNTNAIVQGIAATGTKQQKEIIRDLVIEPKVTFIENKALGVREYRSTIIGNEGRTYPGFSSQLAVEGPPNPEEYEINRQWGEDLDSILAGVILNQKLSDINTPTLNDTIRQKAYDLFEEYLSPYKEAGYVAVPQVIVYDDAANIASAIDLLLISPTGALKVVDLKSSWTSAANIQKYKGTAWPLLPTSRVISNTQSISKFRQHNVQVNTYNKLLRLMGYQDIEDAAIKNIQIMYRDNNGVFTATDIKEDNDQTTAGTGYVKERVVDPSAEEGLVELMVPVAVDYTKDNLETWGIKPKITASTEPESKPYERIDEELTADDKDSLSKEFSNMFEALKQYRTLLADRRAKASNAEEKTDRSKALDTLEEVMSTMLAAVDNTKNGREIAYTQFLLYVNKGLEDIITVLSKEENKHNPLYLHWTIMAEAFVTQFQGYTGLFRFSNKKQEWNNLITDIADKLRTVQPIIIDSYRQGVLTSVIKKYSTRDVILESLVEKDTDLTNMAATFIDMANSRNAILENLDKSFKHDVELIRESTDAIDNRIVDAANQVIKAFGKKDASVFELLFEKDRHGNKTGRFISAIGPVYWEKEEALREPLLDENGQYKEYIKNPKTKEDLQYNKDLAAARKNSYMFWTAEDRVYDEQTRQYKNVEGTYHRYTKEYQDARNEVMRWNSTEGKWVPKTTNAAYWNFINKYHSAKVGYYIADRKKNSKGMYEYTGTLMYVDAVRYTPHPQYKEILETSNDGQDMSNPVYKKLQKATDAKSVALWNFFNVYRNILSEQQDALPTYTNSWFSRNNIPRIQANWLNMMAKEGSNKSAMISSQIKSFFEITAYTHQPAVAMTGDSSQQLPLLFMGRLRDQAVVQRLKTQLAKHNSIDTTKMSAIEKRAWKQEQSRIEENIKIENARITAADIEPDLVEGLRAFVQMSQSFKIKRAAEDRITAVKKTIDNMVFIQEKKNMLGKVVSTKEVAGVDSNAKQRLSDYLAMNYYSGEAVSKEFLDILADRLMKVTSTIGLGFNVFSWANNVTTGVLNNYIDAYGGELYQKRSLNRMKKESTLAIGALVRHKMDSVVNKTLGYDKQKPVSKYEALSQRFNMIEHHIQQHSGKVDWIAKLGGFTGMEKGEWLVQSMVGNAILDSIQVEYTGSDPAKKGSKKSLYDAYEFDEKTGAVTLEEGYELSDHDRRDIINRIRETNKRIHGNYRAIDKVVIEKEWWGRVMMQYHKWVIPAYSARFRKLKYDENLGGGMHIEGRWRSAGKFLMALKDRTITLQTLIDTVNTDYTKMDPAAQKQWLLDVWSGLITAEEWDEMSDEEKTSLIAHRKNNLLKDLMDLVYIALLSVLGILIAAVARGLDDDDEEVKKLLNFFRYQADRSTAELALFVPILGIIEGYQLVKNTIASTSIIKEAGELTKALLQFPFIPDSEKTIQRGPNKGRYKVAKEAGDIIPIIKQLQRWNAFETTKEFWVK
jgi:hypothetical protein